MFERTKALIEKIKHQLTKDRCYDEMEGRGIAACWVCCGVVGEDRNTEYLNYSCIDCKYYIGFKKEN